MFHPGDPEHPVISSAHSQWLPLGTNDDGTVQIPSVDEPKRLGWYCPGRAGDPSSTAACLAPVPGDVGPAVIIGHVNGGGEQGVFANLDKVRKGDLVDVTRNDGAIVRYEIDRTALPDKVNFPTSEVYGDTPGPEVRLISCGGRLDKVHHRYLDQVLAWGKISPTPASR